MNPCTKKHSSRELKMFANSDDPCFGKHNDPNNPICKECPELQHCAQAQKLVGRK